MEKIRTVHKQSDNQWNEKEKKGSGAAELKAQKQREKKQRAVQKRGKHSLNPSCVI